MAQHFPASVPADSDFHKAGRAGWSQHQRQNSPRVLEDDGDVKPPGYILPQALCTTGALFGTLAPSGTASKLAMLAKEVRRAVVLR